LDFLPSANGSILSRYSLINQRIDESATVEDASVGEDLIGQLVRLEIMPHNLDVIQRVDAGDPRFRQEGRLQGGEPLRQLAMVHSATGHSSPSTGLSCRSTVRTRQPILFEQVEQGLPHGREVTAKSLTGQLDLQGECQIDCRTVSSAFVDGLPISPCEMLDRVLREPVRGQARRPAAQLLNSPRGWQRRPAQSR
jgi:hypothetical protein